MMYRKVWFTSDGNDGTAGLVFSQDQLDAHTIQSLSRLFPMSETRFMRTCHMSPKFPTWEDAFMYEWIGESR